MAKHFNPLPPCGGRLERRFYEKNPDLFQSTPSVWRETAGGVTGAGARKNFNPLPPCGGRHNFHPSLLCMYTFQSTPSVWRETGVTPRQQLPRQRFQSTPSVWRETRTKRLISQLSAISIHSLRVEGDNSCLILGNHRLNFNPLPPCGGRLPCGAAHIGQSPNFNPLPPCGGRLVN